MRAVLVLVLALLCMVGCQKSGPEPGDGLPAGLEGTWNVVSMLEDGTVLRLHRGALNEKWVWASGTGEVKAEWVFAAGKLSLRFNAGGSGHWENTLFDVRPVPGQTPSAIDLVRATGERKGQTFLCIYELNGDDLKFCTFSESKADRLRPAKFWSAEDYRTNLTSLKRQTP